MTATAYPAVQSPRCRRCDEALEYDTRQGIWYDFTGWATCDMEGQDRHVLRIAFDAPETPAEELARLRAKFPTRGPARLLESMGHPGYGAVFAASVLELVAAGNVSTHLAVASVQARYSSGGAAGR